MSISRATTIWKCMHHFIRHDLTLQGIHKTINNIQRAPAACFFNLLRQQPLFGFRVKNICSGIDSEGGTKLLNVELNCHIQVHLRGVDEIGLQATSMRH